MLAFFVVLAAEETLAPGTLLGGGAIVFVGLLAFLGRDVLGTQKKHAEEIGALREKLARSEGERLPQRVGNLEEVSAKIALDLGEVKGDLKAIISMLRQEGDHYHRRVGDKKD